MNDCARFANPYGDADEYAAQLATFRADGWGGEASEKETFVKRLVERGLTPEEAELQYDIESGINEHVRAQGERLMALTLPPLFIAFGTK